MFFFVYEKSLERRGGAPLMEPGVLRRPGVVPGLLSACLLNFAYAGLLFILTLHLQQGMGFSPIEAGLSFVPYPVGFATASLLWSRLNTRLHLLLPMLGPLLFAAGSGALIATAQGGWPVVPVSIMLMLCGAGHAIGYSPLVSQIVTSAGVRFASAISALISTGTLLGQVISVAAVGGVYLSVSAAESAVGLTRAILVIDVLLLVATYCAWRLRDALRRRGAESEVPATVGH
jgi:predicted MFS family arabinose efflux permease